MEDLLTQITRCNVDNQWALEVLVGRFISYFTERG